MSKSDEFAITEANRMYDKQKKADEAFRKRTIPMDEYYKIGITSESDLIKEYSKKEEKEKIIDAIKGLTQKQKKVIIEYFYNGKTINQIAKELNKNPKTISETYNSSLKKLKKILINTPIKRE